MSISAGNEWGGYRPARSENRHFPDFEAKEEMVLRNAFRRSIAHHRAKSDYSDFSKVPVGKGKVEKRQKAQKGPISYLKRAVLRGRRGYRIATLTFRNFLEFGPENEKVRKKQKALSILDCEAKTENLNFFNCGPGKRKVRENRSGAKSIKSNFSVLGAENLEVLRNALTAMIGKSQLSRFWAEQRGSGLKVISGSMPLKREMA